MRPSDLIDAEGRRRIESAVRALEDRTRAELVVKVVGACDEYGSAGWRLGVALAAVALLAGGSFGPPLTLTELLLLQAGALVLGHGLGRIPAVRRLLVSEAAMQEAAERRASAAFAEHGLRRTRERTGILILVSLLEHRVVVLADDGVNRRLAPGHGWQEVVEAVLGGIRGGELVEGLLAAIDRCGEVLTGPLPARPDDLDEIPHALVLED